MAFAATEKPKGAPRSALALISSDRASNDRAARVIQLRPDALHLLATEGEDALIEAGAPLYVRGSIVRPVVDELPAVHGKRTKVARLCSVDAASMVDHLSRAAAWQKFNVRKNAYGPADPPLNVAQTILSRDGEWKLRRLAGVITTPTLRPNGTILSVPGYDPETQLLLLSPPKLPPIADNPTRQDALAALAELDGLLQEFPFADKASHSAALSALITPVVRGALQVAPLHATSAPVAGSGKSYIIDLASAISTGERAPVIAAGRTEEETEKRLGAALLTGQAIISIDNVNGDLGGDMLCQLIERPIVNIRPLGASKLMKIESRATVFATGNNIHLVGDMTRRVILCSLDPNMERPELRKFEARPFEAVIADRGRYIAAALTIARAYAVAGYPGELSALASFEDWSRTVRSALVWLGRADPVETMDLARAEDPVTVALGVLFAAMFEVLGPSWITTGRLKEMSERVGGANSERLHGDLFRALVEVAEHRSGLVDTRRLGHFLGRHKGRIVGGFKLRDHFNKKTKQQEWSVVRV